MSLIPYILEDWYPTRYQYGNIYPSDLFSSPYERSLARSLHHPLQQLRSQLSKLDEIEQQSHIGKDGFQVCLDVQHFKPDEIKVKTVDNSIVVEAKHEERQDDHGYISRQFSRRYDLPKGFKAEDVASSLSSDGVLTLKAPPATPAIENVRQVQIEHTGPARIENKNEKKKSK